MPLRFSLLLALLTLAAASLVPACSNQSEGQACNTDNGDVDCEEGLICVSKTKLLGNSDICCPVEGGDLPACVPGSLTGGAGGAGGTGGTGGTGGAGGAGGTGGGL